MGGFAASRILEVHGERMIKRTFDPGFRIELHQKDLTLALAGARAMGVSLPNTATAQELFNACVAQRRRQVGSLGDGEGAGDAGESSSGQIMPPCGALSLSPSWHAPAARLRATVSRQNHPRHQPRRARRQQRSAVSHAVIEDGGGAGSATGDGISPRRGRHRRQRVACRAARPTATR